MRKFTCLQILKISLKYKSKICEVISQYIFYNFNFIRRKIMKRENLKQNKAITLVALVITKIVHNYKCLKV